MLVRKSFECSIENMDEVILELAKEIEEGWTIKIAERLETSISNCLVKPEPCCRFYLERREGEQ